MKYGEKLPLGNRKYVSGNSQANDDGILKVHEKYCTEFLLLPQNREDLINILSEFVDAVNQYVGGKSRGNP